MFEIKQILQTLIFYTNGRVTLDNRGNQFVVETLSIVIDKDNKANLVIGDASPMNGIKLVPGSYIGSVSISDRVEGDCILSLKPQQHLKLFNLLDNLEGLQLDESNWIKFINSFQP